MNTVTKLDKEQPKTEVTQSQSKHALTPFDEMDRLFENFFSRKWLHPFDWPREMTTAFGGKLPKMDVIDREKEILVRAEVPGVKKDDLEVNLTDHTLTIRGSSQQEEKEEKGDYYRCETQRGSFARTVTLPSDVDADQAKASYKDGILEITVPKVEKAQRKTVKIESS